MSDAGGFIASILVCDHMGLAALMFQLLREASHFQKKTQKTAWTGSSSAKSAVSAPVAWAIVGTRPASGAQRPLPSGVTSVFLEMHLTIRRASISQ